MHSIFNRRVLTASALCLLLIFTMEASDSSARFHTLGHKMICDCGCNQILLECNHVGCTYSTRMRDELTAGLQRGDNDDLILQAFVQKYGPTVLAAPPVKGFNRVAWIMPFAIFLAGFLLAMLVIRNWRLRVPALPPTAQVDPQLLAQARKDTEL